VTRIAVIYYSATGNVHALARAVAEGAADEGAEVRLRRVAELREEMLISFKQYWGRHRSELEDQPEAQLEDIEWADGIAFGTPTRFGNVAGQLKVFLALAGELWQQGKLMDKVATAFTSAQTDHGGHESTILALNNTLYHWGRSCFRSATRCTRSSTGAETRTAPRSRATTTSRGRTRKRSSSHGRRERGLRAWRA
jgi:NAD(P)H dehydrogenase (quinone)